MPYLIFFLNHILLYQFTYPQRLNDSLESYLWELSEVVSLDRMSLHVHQILYRLEFFLQWPSCMPEPKSNKQLSPLPNNASLLTLWGTSCNNEIQYKHFNFFTQINFFLFKYLRFGFTRHIFTSPSCRLASRYCTPDQK